MIESYEDAVRVMDENADIFDGLTKAEWFYQWVADGNTHILIALQGMALKAHRYGNRDHYSITPMMETLRWESWFADSSLDFKITDAPKPYLSRLIMAGNEELQGMFKTSLADWKLRANLRETLAE